ncbi:protein ACCELERATED CELL DEATH 6 [Prunus yedoensis var. nudiflora]|uniref:Protein ACCELERATED CELL DEATH 6 n=1 Tax=Prunus yedoensis var. nudiflora TaxID=2094558 RepID=A0A314XK28_PRUYE|nr:protein ACCELERATED CELL DEATH 6 [Prunus yedoensis var. nudiflora]
MAFAAGFTMPGGNNGDAPQEGMAILPTNAMFQAFVICNTIAMYIAILFAVCLIWAQLGDLNLVDTALRLALPLLGIALTMISLAFMAGVYVYGLLEVTTMTKKKTDLLGCATLWAFKLIILECLSGSSCVP